MGVWIPVIVGVIIQALLAAVTYGMLVQGQREHARRLDAMDVEQSEQWGDIGELRENMGKVKGRLGLNGA
jgi:hypothetical protein